MVGTPGPGAPSWRPYPGTCAKLSTAQRDERRLTRAPAIRVRAEGAHFTVDDVHAGPVSGPVDDFVLFRADRTPAYNLAVVVDDGLQGIGQVVRGDDLLDSSPRQGWLATQLGFEVPRYVHVSLALNTDGKRLAKRDGAVTLADLAALGRSAGLERGRDAAEVLARLRPGDLVNDLAWTPWVVTERAVPPARR